TFTVTCSDPDSVVPVLSTSTLPGTAAFVDNLDYTGTFEWQTGYTDAGTYPITFYATDADDASLVDSVVMQIIVADSNQVPYCLPDPFVQTQQVNEGDTLYFRIAGYDDDGTTPKLSINETITNFVFIDSANGFGVLRITPNYQQAGLFNIHFVAKDSDPRYPDDTSATEAYQFRVVNVTVPPVLTPIGPQTVTEGDTLILAISATDPNGVTIPSLFAENLPENAALMGVSNPKSFRFLPSYLQAGSYTVLFRAVAGTLADSEYVTITVLEAGNQPPYFVKSYADTQTVVVGNTLTNRIHAVDPELDLVTLTILSPPANAIFVDSGSGVGGMTFTPTSDQVGATYIFRYQAQDALTAADTLISWIRVLSFMRGDANSDLKVDIADVTYIIDYVFRQGPSPLLPDAADANFDTDVNVTDALYLVNYIFKHGPPPANGGN
ncbi:MAG: hypothetical protein GYA46_08685, partial [candidate division Zixibacteria bacterium]|nr:hypothetical protein [candidate division Zixibacteria bacterium]